MYILFTILGIIFLMLDLARTSTLKLTLSTSFLFAAVVAYKFPSNYLAQGVSFVAFTMGFYCLIKLILKKEKNDIKKLSNLDDIKGKVAIVKKDIGKTLSIDGLGVIELDNVIWSAKSIDDKEIKAGASVEIVSRENMIMNVKVIADANK